MNQIKVFLLLCSLSITAPLYICSAAEKRTDGPAGSEYGDFAHWDGRFQVGLHFGAGVPQGSASDSTFTLGLDLDFKPYDLFGFRGSVFQGLNSPRSTLITLTPLVHGEFSNLKPYGMFGPGIGFFKIAGDIETKFMIAFGGGADIGLTDSIDFGMMYMYSLVFDIDDYHTITARIAYTF